MEGEAGKSKSIPERVHSMYYRMFPGADCPVTGADAKEKLMAASRSQRQQEQGGQQEACSSAQSATSQQQQQQKYKHPHVYDVYGRRIDAGQKQGWRMPGFLYSSIFHTMVVPEEEEINPANRMPKQANQEPAPGQKEPLSTLRQQSSIPKGGTEDTWLYPSPQMFFNSLVRKDKADGVTERDMDVVVATHNTVNETTWRRLLQWEQLYGRVFPSAAMEEPRLLHFKGRPHELSPKARLKKLLGYGEPFDRHDWTVDRGGREMRYIIDFYYDEKASDERRWPFYIDVRPALDSPTAVLLRARMMMHELVGSPSLLQPSSSSSASSSSAAAAAAAAAASSPASAQQA